MTAAKRGPRLIKLTQRKLADNFVKQMAKLCENPIESEEPLNGLRRLADRLSAVFMDSYDDRKGDGSIDAAHGRKISGIISAAYTLIAAIQDYEKP